MRTVAPPRTRRRGTLGAFRRPVVTDLVFWIALAMALVLGLAVAAGLVALFGVPDSTLKWAVPLLGGLAGTWIGLKFLAMGINISRAFQPDDEPATEPGVGLESTGRAAGAVLGKGARALTKGRKPKTPTTPAPGAPAASSPAASSPTAPTAPAGPTPSRPSTPAPATPAPDVTVDKAAKVIGSMVGRRLSERRRDS